MTRAGNPFPGLRPFRADEEPLFFGREAHVDRMVDALGATGFLAVVGSSGSGKSSLVSCGLVPALHRGLLAARPGGWRVATCQPGNRPIRALAQALSTALPPPASDAGGFSPAALAESTLRASKRGLLDAWQEGDVARSGQPNLLVVVDQFEELFRYRGLGDGPAGGGADAQAAEAVAFVNLLLEVPAQATMPLAVVITMRSDFLGECAQFHGLPEAINRGQFLVPRMTRDERRAAIRGPLAVCGASIDPVLLNRLVNDVGDNPDQLSILQHALNRTWARWQALGAQGPILPGRYDDVGRMEHALDRHADEALAMLTAPGQVQLCEAVFRAITDRGTDARGIRRPTRLDTLQAITGAGADALAAVMAPFRDPDRAFLMPPHGAPLEPHTPVDISHESLMRVWTTLRRWTEAEAQSARIYRRLVDTAGLHAKGDTDLLGPPELQVALAWRDRERPNRTWAERYSPGFDAAMEFLDASLHDHDAKLADEQATEVRQRQAEAERQERERQAELARQRAEAEAAAERQRAAMQAKADSDQAAQRRRWTVVVGLLVVLALAGLYWQNVRVADKAEQAERQMQIAIEQGELAKKERDEALATVQREVSQRRLAEPRPAASEAASAGLGLVYLQYADPAQRAPAERLRRQLTDSGYHAPGTEQVAQVPAQNELRYFRPEDADAARALASALPGWGVSDVRPRYSAGYASAVQRRQFELWLARPTTELAGLVLDLDNTDKVRRLAAGQALQSRWRTSSEAIGQVLTLLEPGRIEALSEVGRINALYFLTRTALGAWTPALAQRGRATLARIDQRERSGVAVGAQTRAEMNRMAALLAAVESSASAAQPAAAR